MERAEVVIVGGGVVGASIAYHLAARGVRDVLVLERDQLGSGSTTRNAGGVRLQFSTEINVLLSLRSLPRIERFAEEMGVDPHLRQVGYLFLITEERDVAPFEESLAMWKRLEVPAERLDAAGVHRIFPELRVDDLRFATLCMRDGYCDPTSLLNGYVARAREKGVRFREHEPAIAITREGGRVTAVRIAKGDIACATVVNAAGAWAAEVGRLAGIDLPIRPLRRQIFVTDPVPGLDREFPLTVEFASTLYFHRESGGVLMGMADPTDVPGFESSVNWDFLPTLVERALYRLPILERAKVKTGWAGFYEDTPDKHPIIGAIPGVEGFLCAAGFSGHGIMHAPAAGEAIAEMITDGRTSLDVTPLAYDRFRRGELIKEHNVI
ncbi:MAG TPA: FAD-binding oxidoreductase [Candidatus Limnocylindria bacterium]|nr:FAD-binding oxidoreductase [Candidatus Limnocylindria bacterium]